MKKIFSLLAILCLVFTMAACSGSGDSGKKSQKEATGSNNENEATEEVTITYANWSVGTEEEMNLSRLLIKQFQEDHPNIKVEIYEISGDWNEQLSAAASSGQMPDVFGLSDLPLALANDWLLDLSDIAGADDEYKALEDIIRQSSEYDGNVVAVPHAQNFLGYFVNKDVFNAANLDYPTADSTVDEFAKAIKDVTNVKDGIVGIGNTGSVTDWYPASVNPNMGWFTFNNQDHTYSLDSDEFIAGVNFAQELATNGYAYDNLTDSQKANFKGEDGTQAWLNGGVGLFWDGTWAMGSLLENATFDFDFIGIPGGITVITNDLLGISKTTKHAEAAYEFAKYMSFGKEGFMKRMEIAEKEGKAVGSLPISSDEEVLDEYFAQLNVPGVRKAYDKLDQAILEPVKTVPGYSQSRWNAPTGVKVGEAENANVAELINSFVTGDLKAEDYVKQLNQLANDKYQEAAEALK